MGALRRAWLQPRHTRPTFISQPRNDLRSPGLLEGEGSTNNMRNMCLGITAVVVTVGMVSVNAQGRNFSGTWVVDSEKTMAAMQTATGERRIVEGGGVGGRARGTAAGAVVSAGGGGGAAAGGGVGAGSTE